MADMGNNRISVLDLTPEIDLLWDEIQNAIAGVLRSGQFIMGPNVVSFEREIASYLGVKHSVALNSGTDALYIALRASNVGPGDEVITSPFTFFATAEAISHVGATPVFADVDALTFTIDPIEVERLITSKTRAIIPVHLFGHVADMAPLLQLAEKHKLTVIEDVAQAFGAEYQGRKAGTIGRIGAFSFFPSKNLGAYGDGGMLTTDDDEVAEHARMLRSHGSRRKYYNEMVGYNSRLDEIQASILRVKLPHIDAWNEQRRVVARIYNSLLKDLDGITIPNELPYCRHVYHQYTIRIHKGMRDKVLEHLSMNGVGAMVYYPLPVHQLPVYKEEHLRLPVAECLAGEVLSLPIWPQIDRGVQERVVSLIREVLE